MPLMEWTLGPDPRPKLSLCGIEHAGSLCQWPVESAEESAGISFPRGFWWVWQSVDEGDGAYNTAAVRGEDSIDMCDSPGGLR